MTAAANAKTQRPFCGFARTKQRTASPPHGAWELRSCSTLFSQPPWEPGPLSRETFLPQASWGGLQPQAKAIGVAGSEAPGMGEPKE